MKSNAQNPICYYQMRTEYIFNLLWKKKRLWKSKWILLKFKKNVTHFTTVICYYQKSIHKIYFQRSRFWVYCLESYAHQINSIISLIHCQVLPFGAFLFSFMITICLIICQTNRSYKPSIPKQHLSEEKEKHFTFKRIQMLSNWKNLPICQNKCTIAMKNKTPSPFEHWKMEFHLCKTLKIINNIFNLSYKHRINWKTFILTKSATELFSMFFLVFNAKWFILALKFIQLNAFRLLQVSN